MAYPSAIDSFTGFTSNETLQAAAHASQHNQEQAGIVAVETKVGTGASTPTNGVFLAGNGTGTSTWRSLTTTDIGFSPLSVLQQVYPVGCIYTEITGVNPGTTFGFGTWIQYAQGEVLVGQKTGDPNFGTVGNTGGEATHVLSVSEMPSHNHAITDPGHTHSYSSTRGNIVWNGGSSSGLDPTLGNGNTTISNTTGITINNTGSGSAHNNLQPYITVFVWNRTA